MAVRYADGSVGSGWTCHECTRDRATWDRRGRCGEAPISPPVDGMRVWPHPMMDATTWDVCPVAAIGGTTVHELERESIGGGPVAPRWLGRLFRGVRLAGAGGRVEDVTGPLSAAGVEAVCVLSSERDAVQAEAMERASQRGAR